MLEGILTLPMPVYYCCAPLPPKFWLLTTVAPMPEQAMRGRLALRVIASLAVTTAIRTEPLKAEPRIVLLELPLEI